MNANVFQSEAGRQAILNTYQRVFSLWPVPCETLTIPTRLGNTFVVASGDPSKPALVLLHGSASNAMMWVGDVAVYSRAFRVFAVDIPGEPGRSDPARPPLSGPDYAEWMLDLITALGLEKTSLAGISLGGWMALKFATTHPERVDKLALLCPAGIGGQKNSFLLWAVLLSPFGDWGRKTLMRKLAGSTPMAEETLAYSCLIAKEFKPRMEVIPLYTDEELKHLTMPVLLIAGDQDMMIHSRQSVERLGRVLPSACIHFLPGRGHVLIDQAPAIMEFLTR